MYSLSKVILAATVVTQPVARQVADSAPDSKPPIEIVGQHASMALVALGVLGMTISDRRRRRRNAKSTGLFWTRFL